MTKSFTECRQEITEDSWLADLARASLSAAARKSDGCTASPYDCTGCPEDPRPHLHCPWGGMHKHYEDDAAPDAGG
jgi:hypothetical protein